MNYTKSIYADAGSCSSQDLLELRVGYMRRNNFVVGFCSLVSFWLVLWGGNSSEILFPIVLVALVSFAIGIFVSDLYLMASQRILVGLVLALILYISMESSSISTAILYIPILSFVFFMEDIRIIRYSYASIALGASVYFYMKFWAGISLADIDPSVLAIESLSDCLVATIFTGVFIRNHSVFSRLTIEVSKSHSLKLKESLIRTKLAILELEERCDYLSDVREKTFTALNNERIATQKIKAGQEQLKQFAYAASHDLKEPVRTVRSFYSVIRRRLVPEVLAEAEVVQKIETVEAHSSSMYSILERLLLFSRLTSSKGKKTVFNLSKFFKERISTREFDFVLNVQIPATAEVYMDKESAIRIFDELFSNAVNFSSDERSLEVFFTVEDTGGRYLQCRLEDNGIGIPSDDLLRAINLFHKSSEKSVQNNAGLGLSIVNEIVKRSDGELWLESEEGLGTTVHFELPSGVASV